MTEDTNPNFQESPDLKSVVEALLFASPEPISPSRLAALAGMGQDGGEITPTAIRQAVEELDGDYRLQGRAFEVSRIANGYRLQTRREYAPFIRKMFNPRRYSRLTHATLETLAIVAYKQPITKAEIEAIRGVSVDGVIKTLLDRELIKVLGQKEVLGRPYLYGTAQRFLEHFGLRSLGDLPILEEVGPSSPKRIETSSDLRKEPEFSAGAPEDQPEEAAEGKGETPEPRPDVE